MNLAAQLQAPRDTCRILRSHRSIPLRARASRESPWPSAQRCELLRSQNRAAKIADRSGAPRVDRPAYARWSENVCRQLSQLAPHQLLNVLDINSHRHRPGDILPAGALPEFSAPKIVVGHKDNSAHDANPA